MAKILVVDDNKVNTLLAKAILIKLGWEVVEASSAFDGLEKFNQYNFDIILSDINMPKMSGIEFCQKIRLTPRGTDIKIIAYTAHAMPEEVKDFIANGFNDIITKPASIPIFIEKIGYGN